MVWSGTAECTARKQAGMPPLAATFFCGAAPAPTVSGAKTKRSMLVTGLYVAVFL